MTVCTCEKKPFEGKPGYKTTWSPTCERHGVESKQLRRIGANRRGAEPRVMPGSGHLSHAEVMAAYGHLIVPR